MLTAAGIAFEPMAARVDEDAAKAALAHYSPRDLTDALAEMKALKVGEQHRDALVIGSDSMAVLSNGTRLDKPVSREDAASHLHAMSGARHDLWSAVVIVENGRAVWRYVEAARMHVRVLSDQFIDTYLDAEWPAIAGCVGCYRIEGPGVQIFERIEGSQFTVLGMPLLPVLDYLRVRQVIAA